MKKIGAILMLSSGLLVSMVLFQNCSGSSSGSGGRVAATNYPSIQVVVPTQAFNPVNTCLEVTVNLLDSSNQPLASTSTVTITPVGVSSVDVFSSLTDCTNNNPAVALSSLVLNAGTTTAMVFLRDPDVETVSFQVSGSAVTSSTFNVSFAHCQPGYAYVAFSCIPCSVGQQPNSGQMACEACPVGQSNPTPGAVCQLCTAGRYASTMGSTLCTDCSVGQYSNAGASSCTPCPAGTSVAVQGSATCQPCAPGQYSSVTGSMNCTQCSVNTYSPNAGATACLPCPGGKTSPPGSASCN